jgi:hypothetical protein
MREKEPAIVYIIGFYPDDSEDDPPYYIRAVYSTREKAEKEVDIGEFIMEQELL